MIYLLSKIFIKNRADYKNPDVRRAYGVLCSVMGILLNVLLFAVKLFIGIISGAVSIIADSYNNLSDAGSSLISLFGFKFAQKKASDSRPFGMGRFEYISALVISNIIIVVGILTCKDSITNIINGVSPDLTAYSDVTALVIIALTVLVKVYMIIYNVYYGKKIKSNTMKAVGTDSLSDVIATSLVLICAIIYKFTGLNLDGYCGAVVSLFIVFAGITSFKDTVGDLVGKKPDKELVNQIYSIVLAHKEIVGVHDLVVHDYGPGRFMISLHAEVSGDQDIYHLHDVIDGAMTELDKKLGCVSIIHLDPICTSDEKVTEARIAVSKIVKEVDERITVHDFRMVQGPAYTKYIFDAVIPHDLKMNDEAVKYRLENLISENFVNTSAVIKIEKSYI